MRLIHVYMSMKTLPLCLWSQQNVFSPLSLQKHALNHEILRGEGSTETQIKISADVSNEIYQTRNKISADVSREICQTRTKKISSPPAV
jgi:hypothetical protein